MPSPVINQRFSPRHMIRLLLAGLVLMSSLTFSLNFGYASAQAAAVATNNSGLLRQPSAAPASLTSSTTSLSISPTLVAVGQAITLTASVVPTSATGTVTFSDGATTLGTASLSGGVATLTRPAGLTLGAHTLKASYGGDSNFSSSTSTPQVVPVFNLTTFTNSTVITINDNTTATPYPATITASGVSGNLISTTVQLRGLNHTYLSDVDMLAVAPSGQSSILMSKVGDSEVVSNVDILFDDGAASALPPAANGYPAIISNTYKPTSYTSNVGNFATPAPTGPYPVALSTFKGATSNGSWQLYVRDIFSSDSGTVTGGWGVNLYTYPFPVAFGAGGSSQTITVATAFATPLQVLVNDGNGNPLAGAVVTFTAPSSGASGTFAGGSTIYAGTTNSSGLVTATTFTANNVAGSYNVAATISDTTLPVSFALTNVSDVAASVTATGGSNQSTNATNIFAQPLVATVYDRFNNPINSQLVTFTAPGSGASGTFANSSTVYSAKTNSSGQVTTTTFTANSQTGSYVVTATINGVATPASFNLTNDPASTVQFQSSSYAVSEGVGTALITLTRGVNSSGAITASVVVSNLTTSSTDYTIPNLTGGLDASFASTSGANGEVRDILPLSDGKILVAGVFTTYNGISSPGLVRLNADGSVDSSFNVGSGTDKLVTRVITQPDGKIIIAGQFTTYNGVSRVSIARLASDGSLDTSFDPAAGANSEITGLTLQSDGKILISGSFTSYNNITRNRLARLMSDGSLDTSFDSSAGANDVIWDVKVQPADSKILIVGSFTTYSNTNYSRIARLNTDGSLDTSFTPGGGGNKAIDRVTVQPDGKILIGGDFTTYSGTVRSQVARLNTDGSLDTSFNPGSGAFSPGGGVRPLVLQPDGKILISGDFTAYNGVSRSHFARINSDGSLDTSFTVGTGANNYVGTIGLQSDGRILIGGRFTSYDGTAINRLARVGVIPVAWAAGDSSSKTVTLTITDDSQLEANEQLLLNVTSVSNGGTLGSPVMATLTILDNDRVITATSGSGQSANVSTAFSQTLVAQVNLASTPVTFTAPSSGPSGSFAGGSTVFTGTSDANGLITTTVFTANSIGGSYNVTATVEGGVAPAFFNLTNIALCNPLVVTANLDDGSCGTLRAALVAASTGPTKTVTISLAAGSVISLTTGLTLTTGVSITTTASCGSGANNTMVPPITLRGVGASSGNGLTLAGNNRLYGLWVRGFSGVQIKAPVGSSTKMQCVRASKL